jgi:hypothetical protein
VLPIAFDHGEAGLFFDPDTVWSLDASSGAIVRQLKTATGATICVRRVK